MPSNLPRENPARTMVQVGVLTVDVVLDITPPPRCEISASIVFPHLELTCLQAPNPIALIKVLATYWVPSDIIHLNSIVRLMHARLSNPRCIYTDIKRERVIFVKDRRIAVGTNNHVRTVPVFMKITFLATDPNHYLGTPVVML